MSLKVQQQVSTPFAHETLMVSSTTDYDRFVIDPRNRPISIRHLEELKQAVSTKNFLREFPIVVNREYIVLDGQHRLAVARVLGVPIYYIVSHSATIEDVGPTTASVKKWVFEDYLHYWCEMGKPDYIEVREFCARHPFISLRQAIDLCFAGSKSDSSSSFNLGNYTVNRLAFAEKVAGYVYDFSRYCKFFSNSTFQKAIANLTDNKRYNHKRMMIKMNYLSTRLVKCASPSEYVKVLNEIYNHRMRAQDVFDLKMINANDGNRRGER